MAVQIERWHFTLDDFYRMTEAGILKEDDRVELIDGEIVQMSPIGWQHVNCVNRLNALLIRSLDPFIIVSVQNPIKIDAYNSPQPDFTLIRPRSDFSSGRLPEPEEILLAVEVSDTSLRYDMDTKIPLFAQALIVESWLVSLQQDVIYAYTKPQLGNYSTVREYHRGEVITAGQLPGLSLSVDAILG